MNRNNTALKSNKGQYSLHRTHPRAATLAGFTLIELLVVIAIIGMLASVVLASLNSARGNAADANIQSNLLTVATQAEIYRSTASLSAPYGSAVSSTCPTSGSSIFYADTTIRNAIATITNNGGTAYCRSTTGSNGTFAVSSTLPGSAGTFCVDSSGHRGAGAVVTSGSTTRCQ